MKKPFYTIAILKTSLFLNACSVSSPKNTATPIAAVLDLPTFNSIKMKYIGHLFLALSVLFSVSTIAAEEGMTRADYDEYLALFNANDPSFIKFYHPDVVLELNGSEVRGAQGIKDFYADVKKYISEKVEVTTFIRDGDKLAVEIPTTFEVIADWDDSFWGVSLKKGQVLRIVSWGIYDIEDGKFKTIRTARYKMVNDWQFE